MNAALALRLPFEMLDGVGDVGFFAIDSSFLQSAVQQFSSGSYKGPALQILLIAGLLPYKHNFRMFRAVAKHGLRGVSPKVTSFAVFGASAKVVKRFHLREKLRCGRARSSFGHDV